MEEQKAKRCTLCGEIKPLEDFHKNYGLKDGRLNQCKECNKARNRAYYAKRKAKFLANEASESDSNE